MIKFILGECKQDPDSDLVLKCLISRNQIRPKMDQIRNPAGISEIDLQIQSIKLLEDNGGTGTLTNDKKSAQ